MISIRQATLQDLHTLCELGKQTFSEAFAADNAPTDMAAYLTQVFSPVVIQRQLQDPDSIFFLAELNTSPTPHSIGYAHLIEKSSGPHIIARRPIELSRLYVMQTEIGKGYGAQLMQACINHAATHGFDPLWLGVWEHNVKAQKFYDRWGFQKVGSQSFILGTDVQLDYVLIRSVTPCR